MTILLNLQIGWTLEDNESLNALISETGARIYHRYHMLRQPLENLAYP